MSVRTRSAVVSEQERALAHCLEEAEILHGDEADVELIGVGVTMDDAAVKLCFCPAEIVAAVPTKRGTAAERSQPHSLTVEYSRTGRRHLCQELGEHGFAHVRARVSSNGALKLEHIRVLAFEEAPADVRVNGSDSYCAFSATCTPSRP